MEDIFVGSKEWSRKDGTPGQLLITWIKSVEEGWSRLSEPKGCDIIFLFFFFTYIFTLVHLKYINSYLVVWSIKFIEFLFYEIYWLTETFAKQKIQQLKTNIKSI